MPTKGKSVSFFFTKCTISISDVAYHDERVREEGAAVEFGRRSSREVEIEIVRLLIT